VSEEDVIAAVRARLAAYKAPRRVVFVDEIRRSPAGKADYRWAREVAAGVG
jgi:acyl-CoA synthetase (AMP-forming)/AMP-acid ligase II